MSRRSRSAGKYRADNRFDPSSADQRHVLFCFGCPVCHAAADEDERLAPGEPVGGASA
ncbi:hypothetical protein KI427_10260 [Rhodococcus ruber]|uniref:hypothetical protein n=1 Tax=Rhodococcus ruber TaxID=1830 RepID=UPI0013C3EA9C|nr:hypothetical protein [Rhodococcus ruber]UQB74695.1 hypothetical protein KI427_10260 [Rhodococcus ruber]